MVDPISVMRVPLSLPCQVPVLPGTPSTVEPIEQRTERCAVDAWWMLGRAMVCTLHLRELLGDEYESCVGDIPVNATESGPWEQMHRYPQDSAHPVGS